MQRASPSSAHSAGLPVCPSLPAWALLRCRWRYVSCISVVLFLLYCPEALLVVVLFGAGGSSSWFGSFAGLACSLVCLVSLFALPASCWSVGFASVCWLFWCSWPCLTSCCAGPFVFFAPTCATKFLGFIVLVCLSADWTGSPFFFLEYGRCRAVARSLHEHKR